MYDTQTNESEGGTFEVREESGRDTQERCESEGGVSPKESIATGLTILIYVLCCPLTGAIRYVGKTRMTLAERLSQHLRWYKTDHKTSWLKSLAKQGLKPIIREIERIENSDDRDWQRRERFWIQHFRNEGCNLTNMEEGGLGGVCLSEETKKKISIGNIGKNLGKKMPPRSEEYRAAVSKRKKGTKMSEEQKEKLRGPRNLSDETRAAMSAAKKGKKLSDETRQRMSDAKKGKPGRPLTPEHKAIFLESHLGVPMPEETKKKISETCKKTNSAERLKGFKPPAGWNKGIPSSEETKAKQSASHKARGTGKGPKSEDHRAKISAALTGRKMTEEERAKLRGPRGPNIRTLRKLGLVPPKSDQQPTP